MRLKKRLIVECLGTFLLVFMGTGAIIISHLTHRIGHVSVAAVFGIVVMVLIYSFGHVSGGHFNPAVSIGFLLNKEMSRVETLSYCFMQCVGAVAGSFILSLIFDEHKNLGVTQPTTWWGQAFILEIVLTFILMLVILMSAVHGKADKTFSGIVIGATVGIEALVFGPVCGASMNPARSLGPAVVCCNYNYLWIYFIATTIGAILAVLFYREIFVKEELVEQTQHYVPQMTMHQSKS